MIADPRFAPRRNDLPWLRRRRLPKAAAAPTGTPSASAPSAAGTLPLREFLTGHATGEHHHEPAAPPVSTPPPPSPPAPAPIASGSLLDLDAPAAAPAHPAAPAAPPAPPSPGPTRSGSPSLDLDAPAAGSSSQPPPTGPTASLDLDEAPPQPVRAAAAPSAPSPAVSGPPRRARADVRVRPGDRVILTPHDPTVTLTPLQTGIGTLTIEAAVSDEVGDLRLGCAYELDSDLQLTMQMTQGSRLAPPHSKRPILLGSRDRFERVAIDLRQCRSLRRLVVYAFSEARRPLTWGGTLVITTFGGARIELPLDGLQGGTVAVLLSLYLVDGEFVLRAEGQTLYGDVREASRAYGYDRISWLDDRTPVE